MINLCLEDLLELGLFFFLKADIIKKKQSKNNGPLSLR